MNLPDGLIGTIRAVSVETKPIYLGKTLRRGKIERGGDCDYQFCYCRKVILCVDKQLVVGFSPREW